MLQHTNGVPDGKIHVPVRYAPKSKVFGYTEGVVCARPIARELEQDPKGGTDVLWKLSQLHASISPVVVVGQTN